MSQNFEHTIDVRVIESEDGTVHVRTLDNMDDVFVDDQFQEITEELANVAMADVELPEPAIETKTDAQNREFGKANSWFTGPPPRPSKIKK